MTHHGLSLLVVPARGVFQGTLVAVPRKALEAVRALQLLQYVGLGLVEEGLVMSREGGEGDGGQQRGVHLLTIMHSYLEINFNVAVVCSARNNLGFSWKKHVKVNLALRTRQTTKL